LGPEEGDTDGGVERDDGSLFSVRLVDTRDAKVSTYDADSTNNLPRRLVVTHDHLVDKVSTHAQDDDQAYHLQDANAQEGGAERSGAVGRNGHVEARGSD